MRKIALGVLIILTILLIDNRLFFETKLKLTSSLNQLPQGETKALEERINELEKENKNLKVQLLSEKIQNGNTIKVYSSHPFNNRGEIAIAAGAEEGIKVGNVVTYGQNIIVGKVTKVFESVSVVSTIFDPSWRKAVRIGKKEVDALMQGGNELTLTLIPKEAEIEEGEVVITASEDLPYGLGVGTIKNIRTAPGGAFREALLEPSFQFRQLKDVSIYR